RALEAIADPRALDPALRAIDQPEAEVAFAGISVARAFLHGPRSATVVDRLSTAALDAARDERVRLSAVEALGDLKPSTIAPLLDALRSHGGEPFRRAVARTATIKREAPFDPTAVVRRA